MLALEHVATLQEIEGKQDIKVRAKALGGGVRLTDPQGLAELIGGFHYDSEKSKSEKDFRILINPASWQKVKQICRAQLDKPRKGIIETSPVRELSEEFDDTLHIKVTPDQYLLKSKGITVQEHPVATHNLRAVGFPTVRIYFLYEAHMNDPGIIALMLDSGRRHTAERLRELASQDARQGGKGRANAILTIDLAGLKQFYGSVSKSRAGTIRQYRKHQLDSNVQALII
jgi:hypothetical protein